MYGLKPVPFKLGPELFKLKPVPSAETCTLQLKLVFFKPPH
jgi:hypothetical protein